MEIEKNEDQQLTTNTFMLLANSIRMNKHNEKKFITVRIDEKILSAVPQSVMTKYVVKTDLT